MHTELDTKIFFPLAVSQTLRHSAPTIPRPPHSTNTRVPDLLWGVFPFSSPCFSQKVLHRFVFFFVFLSFQVHGHAPRRFCIEDCRLSPPIYGKPHRAEASSAWFSPRSGSETSFLQGSRFFFTHPRENPRNLSKETGNTLLLP